MTKNTFLLILFTSLSLGKVQAENRVPDDENAFNQRIQTNFFFRKSRNQFILKANLENNEILSQNKSLSLNYRYKISKKLKILIGHGQFYGLRHNEDWTSETGTWRWRDTKSRRESITSLGLQFKKKLSSNLAYQLRTLLDYNSFNEQQDLKLNNGVMWFTGPKSVQLFELRLNLPANYARQTLNYHSIYSGWLYFIMPKLSIGPSASYGIQRWTEDLGYRGRFGDGYEVKNKVFFVGMTLNSYHDF